MKESSPTVQKTSWLRMGLITGLFFAVAMTPVYALIGGNWQRAIAPGVLSGIAFGICMAWFGRRQTSKLSLERPDFGVEALVFEGPANHFVGTEGVGGYLFLTDSRLFFRSHRFNIQNHEHSIALSDIEKVEATKTAGVIPNGLAIWRRERERDRFVVNRHEEWREKIDAARQAPR